MAEASTRARAAEGALARKLRAAAAGGGAAATGTARMTPARALALAFARAGESKLDVDFTVVEATLEQMRPEAMQAVLPDPGLILALRGEDGRQGLAAACPQLVAAVVEAQTMGAVQPGAAADRRATSTDGAMAAGLIEAGLTGAAALAEGLAEASLFAGLACGGLRPDPRSATLGLRDRDHHVWTLTAEAGGGAKRGTLIFALPVPVVTAATGPSDIADFASGLRHAVLDSTARLDAVLARLSLPLAQARALSVGDVIPLTGARLADVQLCGADGQVVVRVQLGRAGERKAVRLAADRPAGFERASAAALSESGAPQPGDPATDPATEPPGPPA